MSVVKGTNKPDPKLKRRGMREALAILLFAWVMFTLADCGCPEGSVCAYLSYIFSIIEVNQKDEMNSSF